MRISGVLPNDIIFRNISAPPISKRDIAELRASIIVSCVMVLGTAVPFFVYSLPAIGWSIIGVMLLHTIGFIFIYFKQYTLSFVFQTTLINTFILYLSILFGEEAKFYYNFIPLLCVAAINSIDSKAWIKRVLIFIPIVFTLLLFWIDFSSFQYTSISLEQMRMLQINALANGVVGTLLAIMGFVEQTRRKSNEVKAAHDALAVQNEELRRVNSELDSFVYSVSHDLRSPLSSLLGLIDVMKNEQDISVIKKYLLLQEKSVHKLDSFIQDIMHLSRNSRTDVACDIVNIRQLLTDIVNSLSHTEHADKIHFDLQIAENGEDAYSDIQRLNIILSNLIGNAYRYMDVSKAQPTVSVMVSVSGELITIRIRDNGIGIPAQHQSRIFEMFYRAATHKTGSGLGLYIVHETVNRLNGGISVSSEEGHYTEFVLEIPNIRPIFAAQQSTTA